MTREEIIQKYDIRKGTRVMIVFGKDNHIRGEVLLNSKKLLVIKSMHSNDVYHVRHTAYQRVRVEVQKESDSE